MREHARRLRACAAGLSVAAGLLLGAPASAQEASQQTSQEVAQDAADEAVDLGLYAVPLTFTAPPGVTMTLGSGRRLTERLEVRPSPLGGLLVVADLDVETYVAGIAEMPARWPLEALKAQAVAARTYAWYQLRLGTFERRGLAYDICASTACQVFRGREVVEVPEVGQRWQEATDATAGEVLLYAGEPILARYFSTSGGATRNNEDVFRSEGPRPYLKGVDDPDDAVSPLHRWEAVFTRAQFDDLLARGQTLAAVSPVADARVVAQAGGVPDRVVVTGVNGRTAEVTAGELRSFLNDVAPAHYPDDFPGPRSDGGRLPSTVPSSRYEIRVTDEEIVLDGRGWGHGVGMGQYGAMGKAERGLTYDEILAAYYSGLRPTAAPGLPERIRVGLADSIDELRIRADGPLEIRAGDVLITDRGLGTWHLETAPGRTVRLGAPAGYGAPLVVGPTTTTRSVALAVEEVGIETVVNKATELALVVTQDGRDLVVQPLGVLDAGRHAATWSLDADGATVVPGRYELALVATDEEGAVAGDAVALEVLSAGADVIAATLLEPVTAPLPPALRWEPMVAAAAVGGMIGAAAVTRRRR